MRNTTALFLTLITLAAPALAQERHLIGTGRIFNNDVIGDGQDRWRTGGYTYSNVRARDWFDGTPQAFGDLLEYRLRAEIITAQRGTGAPGDRPYVGALSMGVHTHFGFGGTAEYSLGADVTAVGPQTGLSKFQDAYHDAFSLPNPPYTDDQVDNAFFLSGTAAVAYPYQLSDTVTLRPFAEVLVGVEDIVRVGGDVIIGAVGHNDLLLRDVVTGQLYRATEGPETGVSYVFGADFAAVSDSEFLPAGGGYDATDERMRARAGVHWQMRDDISFFYGATYLSEEFTGQTEGQVLGSLKLNFNF